MVDLVLVVACFVIAAGFLILLCCMLTSNDRRLKRIEKYATVIDRRHQEGRLEQVLIDGVMHLIPVPESFYLEIEGADRAGCMVRASLQVSKEVFEQRPMHVCLCDGEVQHYS